MKYAYDTCPKHEWEPVKEDDSCFQVVKCKHCGVLGELQNEETDEVYFPIS